MSSLPVALLAEPGIAMASTAPAAEPVRPGRWSQFAAEWAVLVTGLVLVGATIAWSLFKAHESVDATERDRLRVQARVIDDNIGQQLEGMNRALASVRDEYLATPVHSVSTLMSYRLKALSDAIPGVRSMILLDGDGTVVATSVDTLLGRDFVGRDYFRASRTAHDPATLHVAEPYKTSLETYTVVFARAVTGPNGAFAGVVAAALDPEYFAVLMKSVLYAPDMWVSLGHGDGKVFVTAPSDPDRIDNDWQQALGALGADSGGTPVVVAALDGAAGGSGIERMTALRQLSPPALHMDRPLVIAVSRALPDVFGPWRQQAFAYGGFFFLLAGGALFGLHRGQWRRRAFTELQACALRERHRTAEQLGLALRGADLGLWDWHIRSDRFEHDEIIRAQLGYAPGEIGPVGHTWRSLTHPHDAERQIAAIEAHFRRETTAYEFEFRVRHKAGHWVWLLSRGKVVERDEAGVPVRMTGTHMDLSARKRTQAELERSAEMLRSIGAIAVIGGWELDVATDRVTWTEQVFHIHELEPGHMPQLADALDFYPPQARPQIRGAIESAVREGTRWDFELPFTTARGNPRWVRSQGMPVIEEGRVVRLIGAFQDITAMKTVALEMQRLNDELKRLSTTDSLTGVGNRRLFDQTLRTEWLRAGRRGEPLALLMIDIDHFKAYNDHYGHPAGDSCLRQVARMVGASVRRGGELVARYGGEEFALLLPAADLAAARLVAERCLASVAEARIEHRASASSAWLTISIGIASQAVLPSVDAQVLVEMADAALYRAKRCGRNRIEF